MPKLTDAYGARIGDTPLRRIYRGTEIICPGVENLATNPSFETVAAGTVEVRRNLAVRPVPVDALSGWNSGDSGIYIPSYDATGGRRAGTAARKFTRAAASPSSALAAMYAVGIITWTHAGRTPTIAGETWTTSVYAKAAQAFNTYVAVTYYDAAGTAIGGGLPGTTVTGSAGAWVRPFVTTTAPAGAATIGVRLYINRTSGVTVGGEESWATDALIEKSPVLLPYFDGTYNPTPGAAVSWLGTVNASASVMKAGVVEVYRNYCPNPQANNQWGVNYGSGTPGVTSTVADARFRSGFARRMEWTSVGTGTGYLQVVAGIAVLAGETWTLSLRVASTIPISIGVAGGPAKTAAGSGEIDHGDGTKTYWNSWTYTAAGALSPLLCYFVNAPLGSVLLAGDCLVTKSATRQEFFMPAITANSSGVAQIAPAVNTDPDLTPAWVGTPNVSASVLNGVGVATIVQAPVGALAAFKSSGNGVRLTALGTLSTGQGVVLTGLPALAGKTVTFLGKVRVVEPSSGAADSIGRERCFAIFQNGAWVFSTPAPNTPGIHEVRWTVTLPATPEVSLIRFMHGRQFGSVYLDDLVVVEGTYTGPYRDGDSPGWVWTGTPHASKSFGLKA